MTLAKKLERSACVTFAYRARVQNVSSLCSDVHTLPRLHTATPSENEDHSTAAAVAHLGRTKLLLHSHTQFHTGLFERRHKSATNNSRALATHTDSSYRVVATFTLTSLMNAKRERRRQKMGWLRETSTASCGAAGSHCMWSACIVTVQVCDACLSVFLLCRRVLLVVVVLPLHAHVFVPLPPHFGIMSE